MERRVPAVVAVVVTTGPSPSLRETLDSLRRQGYDQLSVLVLANGPADDVEGAVAASCPSAFVRRLESNGGFARACNEALSMVEGAAFLCFCHDDVVLADDAIHLMVEEAFRSNAGIVTPKFVRADDHRRLLHVGLNADRFGATTERVEPGEVDQGQHDTSRDVFVAPGGVTLVRADLFRTLGGFDPALVAMGEDLDLCWRAQVAGSRVVVAPEAVVAHGELLANGQRALSVRRSGPGSSSLSALARRHRLSTMLTCYGAWSLLVSCTLLIALELGECAVALVGRDRERVAAVVGSWRWNLRRLGELRSRRRALRPLRELDDHEIRRLQVAGASRLSAFGSRLVHEGVDAARGVIIHGAHAPAADDEERLDHTVGFGAAFSDDQSFDELDDLGHRGRRLSLQVASSSGAQVALALLGALLFAVGVRNLVATPLPLLGRLAPLDSWSATWHHLFASWTPAGVGSGAAGSPAFGVLGVAGTVVFGRMGLLPRAMVLFALPVGALGIYRLLRGVGSRRARLVGALAYLVLALGPNLVAAGRLDELAALSLLPFVLGRLLRVVAGAPTSEPAPHAAGRVAWRTTRSGQLVLLGAMEAVVAALDPSVAVAVVVAGLGLSAGALAVGERRAIRGLAVAVAATVAAAVLLAPLTIDALASGRGALGVFGGAPGPWSEPGLGGMLRLAVGPFGHGVLSWLVPAGALLALLVGRAERLATGARLAAMGACSVLAALLVARHELGSFTPDVTTLLVPYAVAVAGMVGTGVAAFEQDVAAARFGWRQLVASSALLGVALGAVPFVASLSSGRFDLPEYGFDAELASIAPAVPGGARALWLGDPRALPLASWSLGPGLAFATSTGGMPGEQDLFAPPSPGAASVLGDDVREALDGRTVLLGRLLAAAGVSSVVVVTATAPSLAGAQQPTSMPPPPALLASLRRQLDLAAAPSAGSGVVLFTVTESHGVLAARPEPLSSSAAPSSASSVRDWRPALTWATWSGAVPKGTLLAALAPAGDFTATVDGVRLDRATAFRWAASWSVPSSGSASLVLDAPPWNAVLAGLVLAAWVLVVLAALGGDRLLRVRAALHRQQGSAPRTPLPEEAA